MPRDGATATRRRLRRLALERQGLLAAAPFGRGLSGARRAVETLGYVQIDTISVVSRAHEHVLQARVPGFGPDVLDRLQARREVFEYWAHAAAYLPMRDYRFALPRMHDVRSGQERWIRCRDRALMARVLDRVRAEGPLQARDFEAPQGRRGAGWWDWKPAKRALEQLFMEGELMSVGRVGFQKVYDLAERALPPDVDTRMPALEEYAEHLIERQLAALGCASTRVCVYQRYTPGLRAAVDAALTSAAAAGRLLPLDLAAPGAPRETVYVEPESFETRLAPARAQARILSPFDNLVIHRHRGQSLFDFDYQLECYVPGPKRRFGYFCLPILYRDRLVGRADCKAHRSTGRFEIKRLFLEHPDAVEPDGDDALTAIAAAFADLAAHNGCDRIDVGGVAPERFGKAFRRACENAAPARSQG